MILFMFVAVAFSLMLAPALRFLPVVVSRLHGHHHLITGHPRSARYCR